MILLSAFYRDSNAERLAEFLTCLRHNTQNRWIEALHLFVEEPLEIDSLKTTFPELAAPKINLVPLGQRVTYQTLIAYANQTTPGKQVIIANADIYFDHTLARLADFELRGKMLCLSRWDVQPDGSSCRFDHPGSQDAWIFEPPIPEFSCDFYLGVPGCDNRFAWEAAQAGLNIANPSLSLKAHHLHLAPIRRYHAHQRLYGPVETIPASWLGTPWIWFIIPCRGRLADLKRTIDSILTQPKSNMILVDYACPDRAGEWATRHHPSLTVVEVKGRSQFHGAEARNCGASAAPQDGILCFLDADVALAPHFSETVLAQYDEKGFLVPDCPGPGLDSTLIVSKKSFDMLGGFDETYLGWGQEVLDLGDMLLHAGFSRKTFSAALLTPINHTEERSSDPTGARQKEIYGAVHDAYRQIKLTLAARNGSKLLTRTTQSEIYCALLRKHQNHQNPDAEPLCADVAFHETMGYSIARLVEGVSSHNNDERLLAKIPPALLGLQFTQVVSHAISPILVEFLTRGTLFVLVGTDWEGSQVAVRWLHQHGQPENLPPVETQRGTFFEVWSLVGEAGAYYELPTQVMLVANRLTRNGLVERSKI